MFKVEIVLNCVLLIMFYDSMNFLFLVADKQLYKRLCPSVRPSVGLLVGRSVVIELKRGKTSAFDTLCVCLSV